MGIDGGIGLQLGEIPADFGQKFNEKTRKNEEIPGFFPGVRPSQYRSKGCKAPHHNKIEAATDFIS